MNIKYLPALIHYNMMIMSRTKRRLLAWRSYRQSSFGPSLIVSLSPLTDNAINVSTDEDDHR
jgi:hypothetical protein